MGRKILFITTDQQRYDALGCNGGKIARTPVADSLAAAGINYSRAHNQNVVCMPARSTMITGQYVRTHGVVANGVPLPPDAPSIAAYLHEKAGYRTALLGKAHFEPMFDMGKDYFENQMAGRGSTGPFRGFERMELAMHGPMGAWHYSLWLQEEFPKRGGGLRSVAEHRARVGRRHRRAAGQAQSDSSRALSHRLGCRSHYRISRFARPRRGLVRMDELSRPASSVGSAGLSGEAGQLARPRPSGGPSRLTREDRADPRAETAPLARMVRRPLPQQRGRSLDVRSMPAHARSGARDQRR